MEIPGPVEPRLVVEPRGVDDQRFPFPAPVRPSHPTIGWSFLVIVHVDRADRTSERVDHHDVLRGLNDLEWRGHIVGARYTRQITFDLRSEEHTSELQSRLHLVCRLLLEKKKKEL